MYCICEFFTAKLLEVNRNDEPPLCTHGLPGNPTLYPLYNYMYCICEFFTAKLLEVNRNAEPPPCTHGLPGNPTLYPLTEKYKSFQEYSDNFMVPLLLYETWESVSFIGLDKQIFSA